MFSFDLINNINSKYKSISNPASIMQHIGKVNIYIRGMIKFTDQDINNDSISIIYLLYPAIDNFNDKNFKISLDEYVLSMSEELKLFDAVVVASSQVHNALKKIGIPSYYIPQFTDIDKFYYDPDDKLKSETLFVGTKYFDRPTVPILLENNISVDVYGPDWNGIEKGVSIDNRILRKYYSSAKIVLNDTRPDMKQLNFISNRIFDATACGSLVISDYVKEIEDVYGDSVPMWKTKEELIELVKYYLDPKNEAERIEKAKRAQEITLKNFTSDIAGKKFEEIIKEIKTNKEM
jgi:spore maturation protein CgeB